MDIVAGVPAEYRQAAAEIYWSGFGPKFSRSLGDADKAIAFFARAIDSDTTYLALQDGKLVGVMELLTGNASVTLDQFRAARDSYGTFGGIGRILLLMRLSTSHPADSLHIESVAVSPNSRGEGVGSALLEYAQQVAQERHLTSLTLDVIDTNPRAEALYSAVGFQLTSTSSVWPFGRLYGFHRYHRMTKQLARDH